MKRGLLIDIGGVLAKAKLDVVDTWAARLQLTKSELLSAIYGGNDDAVLIGAVAEDEWWETVRERLAVSPATAGALRDDLQQQEWEKALVEVLRELKTSARTGILSNAWPSQRTQMDALGVHDVVHEVLLSCEIGVAKPAPEAFGLALARLGVPADHTLFIDDTPGHVEAAMSLNLHAHLHTDVLVTVNVLREFVRQD